MENDNEGRTRVQEGWRASAENCADRLLWYCQSLIRKRSVLNCIFLTPAIPEDNWPCRQHWLWTVWYMLIETGSLCFSCAVSAVFTAMLTSRSRVIRVKIEVIGEWKNGPNTSNRSELSGGSACVFSDWSFSGRETENCSPVNREGKTSLIITVGFFVDYKREADVSSAKLA